jgi:hypothetical protein
MRSVIAWMAALMILPAAAAERTFDFGKMTLDRAPEGFRGLVLGRGRPAEWKVTLDEAPPALEPLSAKAPSVSRQAVLAQLSRDPAVNRFPVLIFDGETFGDFRLTTRFKIVGGSVEQAAGLVFHFQNESNYHVVCASALGHYIRCFKVVNGQVAPPFGSEVPLARGAWHELTLECEGPRILCALNGKDEIKLLDAAGNRPGKIGFWTASDTVGYFTATAIHYTAKENPAQKLVNEAIKEYPRVLGLRIYAVTTAGKGASVLAGKDPGDAGQPGGQLEQEVIRQGTVHIAKTRGTICLTAPLRDRNGDPVAAVGITLKSFPGQTEENARVRAQPILSLLQSQVHSLEDLLP